MCFDTDAPCPVVTPPKAGAYTVITLLGQQRLQHSCISVLGTNTVQCFTRSTDEQRTSGICSPPLSSGTAYQACRLLMSSALFTWALSHWYWCAARQCVHPVVIKGLSHVAFRFEPGYTVPAVSWLPLLNGRTQLDVLLCINWQSVALLTRLL